MSNKISKLIDPNGSDRQTSLKAWLVYHGVPMHKLASAIGVHPSMVSRIIRGERAPAKRIQQLIALGIPEELLPAPSPPPGRPPGKVKTSVKAQHSISSPGQALESSEQAPEMGPVSSDKE